MVSTWTAMSVLRPGTLRMWRAFNSQHSRSSSRTHITGFQYTPVASIPTRVTPLATSQSHNTNKSAVNVENSAKTLSRSPSDPG
jgi:hypothetical protein